MQYAFAWSPLIMLADPSYPDISGPLPSMSLSSTESFFLGASILIEYFLVVHRESTPWLTSIRCASGGRVAIAPWASKICALVAGLS